MIIVLDSNVLVAAFATHGLCHEIFELCLRERALVVCEEILVEVQETLVKKIKYSAHGARDVAAFIRSNSRVVDIAPENVVSSLRDSDDRIILAAAVASGAEAIVTGDKDLFVLKAFQGIAICTPRDFWTEYQG